MSRKWRVRVGNEDRNCDLGKRDIERIGEFSEEWRKEEEELVTRETEIMVNSPLTTGMPRKEEEQQHAI